MAIRWCTWLTPPGGEILFITAWQLEQLNCMPPGLPLFASWQVVNTMVRSPVAEIVRYSNAL